MNDQPSFLAEVEAAFVSARGQGLMLVEADVSLVDTWEAAGIPVDVVCRALHEGVQDWREQYGAQRVPPRRLTHYTKYVESAARQRKAGLLDSRAHLQQSESASADLETTDAGIILLLNQIKERRQASTSPRVQNAWFAAEERAQQQARHMPCQMVRDLVLEWTCDHLLARVTTAEAAVLHSAMDARLTGERGRLGPDGIAIRRQAILREEVALLFELEELTDD